MTRKYIVTLLLIGSFIFSVLLVFTFRLQEEGELLRVGAITALIDIAGHSDQTSQTSVIVGYLMGLGFLILLYQKGKQAWVFRLSLIFTLIAIVAESMHLFQGWSGSFNGGHFRIGLLLTLLNTWIFFKLNGKQATSHTSLTIYDDKKQLLD